MGTKHAEGPLRITADGGDWSASHEGFGVSAYQAIRDADGTVVALVVAHSEDFRADLDTESNAALFAAAPVLLASLDPETLEAIADEVDCHEHSSRANSLRIVARNQRAAIAAATGEAA